MSILLPEQSEAWKSKLLLTDFYLCLQIAKPPTVGQHREQESPFSSVSEDVFNQSGFFGLCNIIGFINVTWLIHFFFKKISSCLHFDKL